MITPSLYQKGLAQIYKSYSQDVGKALFHLGTAGTVLSATAQTATVATNKSLNKKEKAFLMNQEIADGAINIGLYYTICKLIKDKADNLVESGKIILDKTDSIISRLNNTKQSNMDWIKREVNFLDNNTTAANSQTKLRKNYTSLFYENTIEKLEKQMNNRILASLANKASQQNNAELLKLLKQGQKEFLGFKNGIGVIAAIGASVLASNIITPICRNIVANEIKDQKLSEIKNPYCFAPLFKLKYFRV